MTLPLTVETLRAAYDYLNSTPPFARWNLPDGDDVKFIVARDRSLAGWHERDGRKHIIAISSYFIARDLSLLGTMAHEMVHLHQVHSGMMDGGNHGRTFKKLAARVCRYHADMDPRNF